MFQIEAFFSPPEDTLYLLLHRPNVDGGSSGKVRKVVEYRNGYSSIIQTVQDPKAAKEEHNALSAKVFHIMFSLCHVILMAGDHCRFDMHWLKEFKMVQAKRYCSRE